MRKVGVLSGRSSSPEVLVQQWVLCKWGLRLYQLSVLHIRAMVRADGILPVSSSKLRLLVINLASVPGGQLVNSPTSQSPFRYLQVYSPEIG